MRFIAVLVIAACGGSSSHPPGHETRPHAEARQPVEGAAAPGEQAAKQPAKPASFPAPAAAPAPTGTWRVAIEFPRLQGRPTAIAVDATGVYLAGMVLTPDDSRMRRWALVKLDTKGGVAWSSVDELVRSPAPERIVLANGAVITAGQDGGEETSRLLMIARHEASTGKRTWQRRFTARDAKCVSPECAGKDQFGGAAVRGTSVLYCATVDKPVEEAFGELSLAKGAPIKSYPSRSDLRAHDIAADAGGIYLLEETLSGAFSLVKLGAEKTEWKQSITSGALRFSIGDAGALLWGKTVEKRATDSGELAWTSKLTGEHIDVATDASGIYATVMIDAKPAPYFAIAQIDPASGDVRWLRKTSGYEETRPTAYVATDKDWIYLFGFEGDKWFVERRRKSDGALGEVTTTTRTVETKAKRK